MPRCGQRELLACSCRRVSRGESHEKHVQVRPSREAQGEADGTGRYPLLPAPPDRDEHSTRRFTSFTCDLQALADWLQGCRIRTVAMESTGVLLDPALSDFGAAGLGGIPGQRSLSEERSWPQKRCFRLSVDPVSAFSWFIAGQLPPTRCHLRRTQSVAASQQSAADDF